MKQCCVILPLRTGATKNVLGNRVFNCEVVGDQVNIFDDKNESVITEKNLSEVQIIGIEFKNDGSMWLM